jgi:hypothetical protein
MVNADKLPQIVMHRIERDRGGSFSMFLDNGACPIAISLIDLLRWLVRAGVHDGQAFRTFANSIPCRRPCAMP